MRWTVSSSGPTRLTAYDIKKELPGKGYKAFLVEMTSQRWRTAEEVDAPEWRHWLTIIQPDKVTTGTALLMISGGSKNDRAPSRVNPYFAAWAVGSGAVVAELLDVPNEPLVFAGDPTGRKRSEDQITAWTWKRYLETKDESWPIHLPMAKAAVRAMDTVSKVSPVVKEFVLAGGSKRGWTAWLAGGGRWAGEGGDPGGDRHAELCSETWSTTIAPTASSHRRWRTSKSST